MKIGAMNHPGRNPIAELDWIGHHGFDFVDFALEPPSAGPDQLDVLEIQELLAKHNLSIVVHAAWFLPLLSPFPSIREAAMVEAARVVEITSQLGASLLTTHYIDLPPLFGNSEAIDWSVEALSRLCALASRCGVTVGLENMPHAGARQLDNLSEIMSQVPDLRFHLDIGHTLLDDSSATCEDYLAALGDRLIHVHVSDNDGREDLHLPLCALSRRGFEWPTVLALLKAASFDGTVTVEVFSPEKQYVLLSRSLLQTWWSEG